MTLFARRLCGFFVLGFLFVPWGGHAATDSFEKMAGELAAVAQTAKVKRLAVLEFTLVNGQGAIAGRVAQERFIYAFVTRGDVVVVERDRLDSVKHELTLGMTGLLDEATTKRIGKILGVDALVYGSLTDRKKSFWDIHAWLVAVETGEILGAATSSVQQDLLGGESAVATAPTPVQGWRIPTLHPPLVSTSSETGAVLFENTAPMGAEPQILKLTLVREDKRSAAFELEYFIPTGFEGKSLWISLDTDDHGGGERKQAFPGKQVSRLECHTTEEAHVCSTSLQLVATLLEDDGKTKARTAAQEWIPFQKIWINESNRGEFPSLRGPSAMKIAGLIPSFVPWKKGFVLFGEFGNRPNQKKKVIVGGPDMYLELTIREWAVDKITVDSPQSNLGPVKPYRIDPERPYFIAVTSGKDHSNLFYFQFDPVPFQKN
ncbi:MAG: hypothetical protein IPP35_02415 [Elusimicrobia bacterium]|nr:hypothetical protein [Elusimicrobiota bacterium]